MVMHSTIQHRTEDAYQFICDYHAKTGCYPTYSEISIGLKIHSTAKVSVALKHLEEEHRIEFYRRGKYRFVWDWKSA